MPVAADISELLIRVIIADNAIVDQQSTINTGDDWWFSMGNIRLLYCTAITRFINYVNEVSQTANASLIPIQNAVRKFGIPRWIVEVRHAATHNHMPSLTQLRQATAFCRHWLWEHYWQLPIEDAAGIAAGAKETQEKERRALIDRINTILQAFERRPHLSNNIPRIQKLLATKSDVLLQVLVAEGHLIMNQAQLERADWQLERGQHATMVPQKLQTFWHPVFNVLLNGGALPKLLRMLVLRMSHAKVKRSELKQLSAWVRLMIDGYCKSTNTTWSEDEWKLILKAMLKIPHLFPHEYIERVLEKVTSISSTRKTLLQQLLQIPTDAQCSSTTNDQVLSKSINDIKGRLRSNGFLLSTSQHDTSISDPLTGDSNWVIADASDWHGVPIGLTPDQTAESICLILGQSDGHFFRNNDNMQPPPTKKSRNDYNDDEIDVVCIDSD